MRAAKALEERRMCRDAAFKSATNCGPHQTLINVFETDIHAIMSEQLFKCRPTTKTDERNFIVRQLFTNMY